MDQDGKLSGFGKYYPGPFFTSVTLTVGKPYTAVETLSYYRVEYAFVSNASIKWNENCIMPFPFI